MAATLDLGLNADLMVVVGVVFGIMEGGSASGDGIAFHASRCLCKQKVERWKKNLNFSNATCFAQLSLVSRLRNLEPTSKT